MAKLSDIKKAIEKIEDVKGAHPHFLEEFVVSASINKKGRLKKTLSFKAEELLEDPGDLRSKYKLIPLVVFIEH